MTTYRLILTLHILAIISWMCGILYLWRLFINHSEKGRVNADIHELLVGMEDRLYRIITKPAMLVATIAGAGMLYLNPSLMIAKWMMVKLVAVIGLIAVTAYAKLMIERFAKIETPVPTSRTLRM